MDSSARERVWYDDFFIQGSFHQYFAPEMLSDYIRLDPGFRAALGYEYNSFHLSIESGYSRIAGSNELVLDITIVPLVLKFGYHFSVFSIFGLQADLGLGVTFLTTNHYETALDWITGNLSEKNETSFFTIARGYVTITPFPFLRFLIGGGVDVIFEIEGPIALPVIEAAVSFYPFKILPRFPERKTTNAHGIVFESRSDNVIIEETPQGRIVRLLNAVYFEANSSVMIERYRYILNEAGERLRANPSLRITLRGYTAPFGTAEGRAEVSAARARYCADYLHRHYGIAESRMRIESYGADRAPAFRDATWESYRCVELIIGE